MIRASFLKSGMVGSFCFFSSQVSLFAKPRALIGLSPVRVGIVHDNQGHDLSYRTFINGILSGNILIDTTQIATDTIDYVATDTIDYVVADTWGTTSTRTVIIEAASLTSI